jgi:hypothetical protein
LIWEILIHGPEKKCSVWQKVEGIATTPKPWTRRKLAVCKKRPLFLRRLRPRRQKMAPLICNLSCFCYTFAIMGRASCLHTSCGLNYATCYFLRVSLCESKKGPKSNWKFYFRRLRHCIKSMFFRRDFDLIALKLNLMSCVFYNVRGHFFNSICGQRTICIN